MNKQSDLHKALSDERTIEIAMTQQAACDYVAQQFAAIYSECYAFTVTEDDFISDAFKMVSGFDVECCDLQQLQAFTDHLDRNQFIYGIHKPFKNCWQVRVRMYWNSISEEDALDVLDGKEKKSELLRLIADTRKLQ